MLTPLQWISSERADLHVHSHHSDGDLSPTKLVAMAASKGLRILGITDHATQAGVAEAVLAGVNHGVYVLPGIELNGVDWDFLGYLPDERHPSLIRFLEHVQYLRQQRMRGILDITARICSDITWEELVQFSMPATPTRTHLARLLVIRGLFSDVGTAFQQFLGRGGKGYIPVTGPADRDCVQAIGEAGGVTVLAHPRWALTRERFPILLTVRQLHEWGVVGCEEVILRVGDRNRLVEWQNAIKTVGWIVVGGSNFHGNRIANVQLGERTMGADDVAALLGHLPTNTIHRAWFKRLFWRANNMSRSELESSMTPEDVQLDELVRQDLLTFDPVISPVPTDFIARPFVLIGPGAMNQVEQVLATLVRCGCEPELFRSIEDYPKVAWTLYDLFRLAPERKRFELFRFSLDRHLFGEQADRAMIVYFRAGTVSLREIKQSIRRVLGPMRFYRVIWACHSELNFTAHIHIPEEEDVAEEGWKLAMFNQDSAVPTVPFALA